MQQKRRNNRFNERLLQKKREQTHLQIQLVIVDP